MKLVINIPCYNEEHTLPVVLRELPRKIEGIDQIEVQIVDDGSTDGTSAVAREHGCRVIRHKENLGLGRAFRHGVEAALRQGADIMVNTDADNQYPSKYIEALVAPILKGRADVVIGDRQTWHVGHFSLFKKIMQRLGSAVVRRLTGTSVTDAVSGFRAYSRESLLRLNVVSRFSYVLDTIMQCAKSDLRIESLPMSVNPPTRPSRLFAHIFQHMWRSGGNLLRIYVIYNPFATFCLFSTLAAIPGVALCIRFLYYYVADRGHAGHIQSLIGAAILLIVAALMFVLGIIGALLMMNRILLEEQLYLHRKREYSVQ